MSSIPEAAMHHAKAHDDHPPQGAKGSDGNPPPHKGKDQDHSAVEEKLRDIAATVKAHPVAAAAVGATVIAGAVAAVAAPKLRKSKPGPKPKPAAKKPAPKKKPA